MASEKWNVKDTGRNFARACEGEVALLSRARDPQFAFDLSTSAKPGDSKGLPGFKSDATSGRFYLYGTCICRGVLTETASAGHSCTHKQQ